MNKILLQNILCNGAVSDILIEGNRFKKIASVANSQNFSTQLSQKDKIRVIDCSNKAIIPPFYNAHTHGAMTLLRGYADDMPLQKWLNEYIWPFEAKMTPHDIYVGTRLAILEMIKSGTVFYGDMYWHIEESVRAVEEMGIRASIGLSFMDSMDDVVKANFRLLESPPDTSSRVTLSIAPHAPYTVGKELFQRCAAAAREHNMILQTHLSETEQEVDDCIREHGMRPAEWLAHLNVLGSNVVAAHCVYIDDEEMALMKEFGVTVVNNPCSNMKLHSGIFRYESAVKHKVNIAIGTDGCSSNNSLDMHEEMKVAALLTKIGCDVDFIKVSDIFSWATINGAKAFGIDAGVIEEGKLADALIINLNNERVVPNYNFYSNWVYAADNRSIDYVICDGNILMEKGKVRDEETIIAEAQQVAQRFIL